MHNRSTKPSCGGAWTPADKLEDRIPSRRGRGLAEAVRRYDPVSPELTERFLEEFRRLGAVAARNPGRFHPAGNGFRRANLRRFPYHFLYREIEGGIRVTLVKHHRRGPAYGMERK